MAQYDKNFAKTNPLNQESKSPDQNAALKARILIVDDDRILRMMLQTMLDQEGYSVLEAKDGQEALNLLSQHKNEIDLILLDREMPVMNGIEFIKQMHLHEELSNIPVIMQSGSDSSEHIDEALDLGVFDYILKPLNKSVVKTTLYKLFRSRKSCDIGTNKRGAVYAK